MSPIGELCLKGKEQVVTGNLRLQAKPRIFDRDTN